MRFPFRSRTKDKKGPEDLSDTAAWLYTDLLLGLMVAFLGAGTFLIFPANETTSEDGSTVTTTIPPDPTYQLSCEELELIVNDFESPAGVEAKVNLLIAGQAPLRRWQEPLPAIILVLGGPNNDIGDDNAKEFGNSVMSQSATLRDVELRFYGSNNLSETEIKLVVYVIYKGDKRDNGCNTALSS